MLQQEKITSHLSTLRRYIKTLQGPIYNISTFDAIMPPLRCGEDTVGCPTFNDDKALDEAVRKLYCVK